MANSTRPSGVFGTSKALSPGNNERGEDEVRPLARRHQRRRGRVGEVTNAVAECARWH